MEEERHSMSDVIREELRPEYERKIAEITAKHYSQIKEKDKQIKEFK